MARDLDSKCKKCRRAGEKLFLKGDRCFSPKCAMVRKPYPPGVHGKTMTRGRSEFGRQLAMKQKIKWTYGLLERQFRKHFKEASRKKGVTGDILLARLETRLDNVVYRMGWADSRVLARQLVGHGFFKINGKKVTIPSYEVKVGDTIAPVQTKQKKKYLKERANFLKNKKDFPAWIYFDADNKMEGKIIAIPKREDVEASIDPQLVVEFYSK